MLITIGVLMMLKMATVIIIMIILMLMNNTGAIGINVLMKMITKLSTTLRICAGRVVADDVMVIIITYCSWE